MVLSDEGRLLDIKLFSSLKLSRINVTLVLFTLVFVLSAYTLNDILTHYGATYGVDATKLDEKPETYFPLDNPDSYVLEAISNPNKTVIISKQIFSGIYEMQQTYGTKNIEFSNNYYEIQLIVGDRFPPYQQFWPSLISMVFSGISIIAIFSYKIISKLRSNKK
jgi:hypothetical protein